MKTVLVTGATGHLGIYVVETLAAQGWRVLAASRSGATPAAPFGGRAAAAAEAIAVDLSHEQAVERLRPAMTEAEAVVHLAAWHPPATAASTPADRRALIEANVLGTQRLLDAFRSPLGGGAPARERVVVYASTFEVYGVPKRTPVDEEHPTSPITDYGATKLAGEDHLMAFAAEERVRVVALRMPAIYGPGESVSRALPNFLRAVVRGDRPVIHGDGSDRRDQLHARDAARAIACALSTAAAGIYNVSDGGSHTILDLAREAMSVAGLPGDPERRPAEKPPLDFHMNVTKARQQLGFVPQITLRAGMSEQIRWLREAPR